MEPSQPRPEDISIRKTWNGGTTSTDPPTTPNPSTAFPRSDDTTDEAFASGKAWFKEALSSLGDAAKRIASNVSNTLKSALRSIADIVGKIWTLPNTLIGLLIGLPQLLAGAKARIAHNAVVFDNAWDPFKKSRQWTLGNVIFNPEDKESMEKHKEDGSIGEHEEGHTYQYEVLGPLFLPVYIVAGAFAQPFNKFSFEGIFDLPNPFEKAADVYKKTGMGWWP